MDANANTNPHSPPAGVDYQTSAESNDIKPDFTDLDGKPTAVNYPTAADSASPPFRLYSEFHGPGGGGFQAAPRSMGGGGYPPTAAFYTPNFGPTGPAYGTGGPPNPFGITSYRDGK